MNWLRSCGLDADALDSGRRSRISLRETKRPTGAEPIALGRTPGTEFGAFVPQLGDGRAILLGEVEDGVDKDGARRDVQLKGSGRTPFSRGGGDGRAALGPVLREYVVSEAMAAFGIPTTRALAAVTTGEPVYREEGAAGHHAHAGRRESPGRVGTFQYFAGRGKEDKQCAGDTSPAHALGRHYPDASGSRQRPGAGTTPIA